MIKLVFPLHRRADLTREEFQTYWRESHAPLVIERAETLGIKRYVQVHTSDTPINPGLREGRGGPEAYDGTAELWFESEASLMASLGRPEWLTASAELVEDEHNFVDLTRSPLWLGDELVIVNNG